MRSLALFALVLLAACQDRRHGGEAAAGPTAGPVEAPATATAPAAAAAADTGQGRSRRFQALGTEPFWSFDIAGDRLSYTSPEQFDPIRITAQVTAMGMHGDGGLRYSGMLEGRPLTLSIQQGACSDGMSDTVYPYRATFTWGDEPPRSGCAREK